MKNDVLFYDLTAELIQKYNYTVLYLNQKTNEVWLYKRKNKEQLVRIITKEYTWKNRMKQDVVNVFSRTHQLSEIFSTKNVKITNIYLAENEPVDDWTELQQTLTVNKDISYSMNIFYKTKSNLTEFIDRLNQDLKIKYEGNEEDRSNRIVENKNIIAQAITSQKKQAEKNISKPYLTVLLIAINIFIFLLMTINGGTTDPEQLVKYGANFNPLIIQGEWWRFISSMFIHIGLLHLFMNMLALYYLGILVERIYGSLRFFIIYFLSGIAGSVTSFAFSINISAGASGALFGMFGALIYFSLFNRSEFGRALNRNIITILAINIIFGIMIPQIDMGAHLGGLVAGLIAAAIVGLRNQKSLALSIFSLATYLGLLVLLYYYGVGTTLNQLG